ncbi:hypothetical protein H2Y56_18595 [Pectobacterium aroidearum]|uniref:Uncharacterized protein n=1 Tax=Pectobacterium aroidearum TaxID=1201031 RepID=A0ABR5ZHW2_9GAMM|nr:hypothetical protein [Pectobacterium aroidearum]MBA5201398.1 hypothetical protein [Pectobacterium aroidearum]MBA5234104.1 hypothetical protein [Pectobacterium aroidearum]MBA5739295.1 hypothetical protein [Pectobacterium aroidearum]
MNYYKLGINPDGKKWKGYMNVSSFVSDENGNEFSDVKLEKVQEFKGDLCIGLLREGKIPPVISIGSRFLAFDSNIFDGDFCPAGAKLTKLSCGDKYNYMLVRICNYVDCVDWSSSKVDLWPAGYTPEEWENKRGRFFIEPVLQKNKIPRDLDIFRLSEWGGAFNIIISECFKNKLLGFEFDDSFLEFRELVVKDA